MSSIPIGPMKGFSCCTGMMGKLVRGGPAPGAIPPSIALGLPWPAANCKCTYHKSGIAFQSTDTETGFPL